MFKTQCLYQTEIYDIIDKYCHIIKYGFYTGEEISNMIKENYPENITDILFVQQHIEFMDKSLMSYMWKAK